MIDENSSQQEEKGGRTEEAGHSELREQGGMFILVDSCPPKKAGRGGRHKASPEELSEYSAYLRRRVADAGLKKKEYCKLIGCTASMLSKWIHGTHIPTRFYRNKIASLLVETKVTPSTSSTPSDAA